jgi:DNA-directed RNA polymerase subunit RPC12/RpoP
MSGPVTLADLSGHCKKLQVVCPDCGHEWDCPVTSFRLPATTPLPEVSRHIRCCACGSQNMRAKPPLFLVESR